MADNFLGEIRLFAAWGFVPEGWLACNGQSVSAAQYADLYSLIGNMYGGDQKNFNLPDLRGRIPIGQGQGVGLSPRAMAQQGGVPTVTLTDATMPVHGHAFNVSTSQASTTDPDDMMYGSFPTKFPTTPPYGLYTAVTSGSGVTQQQFKGSMVGAWGGNKAGGVDPHPNVMPTIGMTYMIAMQGIYPTRA